MGEEREPALSLREGRRMVRYRTVRVYRILHFLGQAYVAVPLYYCTVVRDAEGWRTSQPLRVPYYVLVVYYRYYYGYGRIQFDPCVL